MKKKTKDSLDVKGKERNLLNDYYKEIKKNPILTKEQEIDLIKKCRAGDENARNKLIKANLRFVMSIAGKYTVSSAVKEELNAEGYLGLIDAIKKFDETRGIPFIGFARSFIVARMNKFLKVNCGSDTISTNDFNGSDTMFTDDFNGSDTLPTDDFNIGIKPLKIVSVTDSSKEYKAKISKILSKLPLLHQEIIRLYYGMDNMPPIPLSEIKDKEEITQLVPGITEAQVKEVLKWAENNIKEGLKLLNKR